MEVKKVLCFFFSLCELVRCTLRSSGPGSQGYGCYRMSFQKVIYQNKKHMAGVCNLYQERVRRIKTVLFLIIASMTLTGETVPTKWWPCQDKIMTTTAATVENLEKAIHKKLKVLQLLNENSNKIVGNNLLKPIQRHCKLMGHKVEESHEINNNYTRT